MVTAIHVELEDSRRLKPPGRFPLGTKVAEFPTYRISFMKKIFFLFILLQNADRPHIKDWSMPF